MDASLIRRKAGQAERALRRVKERLPRRPALFARDFDAQDIVYRNFQIAVQNCVDIGSHVIAEKGWGTPRSMGDVFGRLSEHRFLPSKMALELRRMTILRNIIVHDYARIDIRRAFPLLKAGLRTIPRYCLAVLSKVGA